jgi:pimeloyl-ACP methyl ester carboxylesterase
LKMFVWIFVLAVFAVSLTACVTSANYNRKIEAKHPPVGQMVPVNGKAVHALVAGEAGAPPILMLHGASANAREFSYTLAPRLSDDFLVLMVDRPGHGYSERPEKSETLAVQAAQAIGALETLAPGQKAVVVGHSFGGAVALRVALDRPDLVSGLVLSAPVSHDWGGGGEAWYNGIAATPVLGVPFSHLVPLIGPARAESGVDSVFEPQPAPEGYFEKSAIGLLFRPKNFRANAHDVDALEEELRLQKERYPELTMPIVVFSGSQDTVIAPRLHVGQLKEQVPVELVVLPEEGHMPHHGEGKSMAEAIRRLAMAPVSE